MIPKTRWTPVLLLAIGITLIAVGGRGLYKQLRWKRFATVHEDKIYRSGQLLPRHLESAIEKLRLKTVICLNPEAAGWERELCEKRNVAFHSFPMPSSGLGDPEDLDAVVDMLSDPDCQPVLVHCSAGVARTGASVALYRMSVDNWTFDQAIDELRSFERRGRCEPSLQTHIAQVHAQRIR